MRAIIYHEEDDGAATAIQSTFRGKKGRENVDKRQKDVKERREDIRIKEEELDRRKTELIRKEEVRNAHKKQRLEEQNTERETLISRKMNERDGGDPGETDNFQKAMSMEDQSAVHIQRIARGFLGKMRWNLTFETHTKSAKVAQSLLRGFAARRFVWKKIEQRDSSQLIQKMMRGALARMRVKARREENTRNRAARTTQALFRAFKGKKRMQAKRNLIKVATEAKAAVDSVFMSDLDELCSIGQGAPEKRIPPHPALLSMIQCVRILWSAGHGPPPAATSAPLRWNRLRRRILRPSFLPRLRSLAQAAVDEVLQISPSRIAAVKVFFNDEPGISEHRVSNI